MHRNKIWRKSRKLSLKTKSSYTYVVIFLISDFQTVKLALHLYAFQGALSNPVTCRFNKVVFLFSSLDKSFITEIIQMKMLQSDWLSIRALNNTINHKCSEARLFDGRRVISVILDNVYLDWIQIAYLSVHGWIKPHCKRFLSGAPGFCLPRFFLVKIWSFLKSFAFMRISELRKLKTTIEPERKRKRAS